MQKDSSSDQVMSWQTLNNSPVASSRTDDIWFFDEHMGWLVNSSGYVCKTTDGGDCWHPKFYVCPSSHGKPYLRCMGWGSRRVGWFGAVTGVDEEKARNPENYLSALLHQTRDGGETWQRVLNLPKATAAGVCGFYAVNERVAYGSGTNDPGLPGPSVIKTVDGGETWQLIDMSSHASNLIDIYFFDENVGFVVGGKNQDSCPTKNQDYPPPRLSRYVQLKPVVLRTLDGGKTWQNMAANTAGLCCGEWGWKIQFLDRQTGFISLENFSSAAILRTTDGGVTWVRHNVQDGAGNIINVDLEGIGFISPTQGWVGGWGINFEGLLNSYTQDGGVTWIRQDNAPAYKSSDPRLRINRYRFIGNPVTAGYCSGSQVYKLQFGSGPKKSALPKRALADRLEPHGLARKVAFTTASPSVALPQHDFDFGYTKRPDGKLEISYQLPEASDNVFVGIWNQFAFYIRSLVHEKVQRQGRQTVIWDGLDDAGNSAGPGVFILRLSVDGRQGGSCNICID